MKSVLDKEFKIYGRVLEVDAGEFVAAISNYNPPAGEVTYEASVEKFEKLALGKVLQNSVFGGLPVEFGHCSGYNKRLDALEYHRSSEVDIAATDLVIMVGRQQDIDYAAQTYDTAKVEMFFVPAGTVVELFATTLHYAPCNIGDMPFKWGVVLPRGTNFDLQEKPAMTSEDKMLFAVNKWLLAHPESGLENQGAVLGLKGENLKI